MQQIHNVSRVQRLSFISFGEEPKVPEPAQQTLEVVDKVPEPFIPEPPPKLITEEEVKAARTDGKNQGYKEGYAAAEAKVSKETVKREEDVKAVLDLIANRITLAAEEHTKYIENKREMMNKLVLGIAHKVAGDAMKSDPYATVETVMRECLGLIIGEPKIVVTVSEALTAGLKQRIDSIRPKLSGFTGDLVVESSADIKDNDCRVEWKNGYGEHDAAKIWNDIETIIAKIGKS